MIDKNELLHYLKKEFTTMDYHFTWDLVENVIDYAEEHCNGLDEAHKFLVNMIPDVTMEEIEPFINYVPFF